MMRFDLVDLGLFRHVVEAGLARRCTVQLAYAIGVATPVSVAVELHGTGRVADDVVGAAIGEVFDLSPAGIIRELDLLRPIYASTAAFGHFGRWRDPAVHRWEATPKLAELEDAVARRLFKRRSHRATGSGARGAHRGAPGDARAGAAG